jgi:NAD(P)H-hydrate repair Nnr-like enzyme with NAD(P)H-hydrate epimerase domain
MYKIARKIKQSQLPPQQQYRNNNNHSGWAGEDVNIFKEEEFDFQKNLDMFDKKKVFAEIRESDETAPEELLVTLNRLPQKEKKIVNLLPSENVLDNLNERTAYYNDQEDDFGDESDNDSQTPNEFSAIRNNKRRSSKGGGRRKGSLIKQQQLKSTATVKIVTAKSGIICPTVLPLQMAHVEHECKKISPSFEELSIENSARGTALLILQQQLYTATTITVVILVGANNKNGAVGLATARHLINHGCLVTCCVTSAEEEDDEENDLTMKYQLQAEKFGVSILSATTNLPTKPDFIIDAILGSEDEKLIDIQQQQPLIFNSICNMINWTNTKKKTPIISIDFPTGIDSFSGIPMHPEYIIRPKWTICLGAPKSGCKSKNVTGDLFLLDIGISRLSWKKIGIKGNTIPWGADFLVALDYDI